MALRLFVKNIAPVKGVVHSGQGRFCVIIPKSAKPTRVGQAGQTITITAAKVGLVRFLRGLYGVGVVRAHLRIFSKCRIVDKRTRISCFEGAFKTFLKRGCS